MAYFDPRPKERLEDLFDRRSELEAFVNALRRGDPLVLILGLRRMGKTSLLYTGLGLAGYPSIVVDCRILEEEPFISYTRFLEALEEALNKSLRKYRGLRSVFERIEGVEVYGLKVRLAVGKKKVSLHSILEGLNEYGEERGTRVVVALDEAQVLSRLRGVRILPILAYAYDNLRRVAIVLTGSQVGLLYRLLGRDNPSSPLYGRIVTEVKLGPLSLEDAERFLVEGFKQYNMEPPRELVKEALDLLDGSIGWLTYFGAYSVRHGASRETLARMLEEASKIALSELENFLRLRPAPTARRYITILSSIAGGARTWSAIKRFLEVEESKRISDSILSMLLRTLIDAGFVVKTSKGYTIPDPILKYALQKKASYLKRKYK